MPLSSPSKRDFRHENHNTPKRKLIPDFNIDLVRRMKANNKDFSHSLGGGLLVTVDMNGTKTLRFRYRLNGSCRTMTLGDFYGYEYDEIIELWRDLKASVKSGTCPMAEQRKALQRKSMKHLSIASLSETYLNEHVARLKNPKASGYYIEKHIKPKFGTVAIDELSLGMIHSATKTLKPTVIRKTVEKLNSIIEYAQAKGLIDVANVLQGKVSNFGEAPRKVKRFLTMIELQDLLPKFVNSSLPEQYKCLTLLLLLTGQRKNEILRSKWSEVDWNNKTLSIAPERVKTERLRKDKAMAHIVFLCPTALELLRTMQAATGNHEKIFTNCNPNYYNEILTVTLRELNFKHFTPHDLRRTFFTNNLELGVPEPIVKKIVNHKLTGTQASYDQAEYRHQRIEAMNVWGSEIKKLLNGR